MSGQAEQVYGEAGAIERVARLFGGRAILRGDPKTPIEAHDLLLKGLPGAAMEHLVGNLVTLQPNEALERAFGMSVRTYQRRKKSEAKPLTREQSGRTWKFAEILAHATEIFGSQEEAELWLERPATGLDQRRPIDLLATTAGTEIVETHLARLEHGVYS